MMAFALGIAIGSATWGWLARSQQISSAFVVAGIMMVLTAILLHPLQIGSLNLDSSE